MDRHTPFQTVDLSQFNFSPSRYVEYEGGHVKSQGRTRLQVSGRTETSFSGKRTIKVTLSGNDLSGIVDSSFEFDTCMTLEDRYLLFINAQNKNVEQMTLTMFPMLGVPYTRASKTYGTKEPVLGSIYTENGTIAKMSFTICNPERLIELF